MKPTHGILSPIEINAKGQLVVVTSYGRFVLEFDGSPVAPSLPARHGLVDDLNKGIRALNFCLTQIPEDYRDR
jgi:hypothetical protein